MVVCKGVKCDMNLFKCLDLEYRKSCIALSRDKVGTHEYYVSKKRQEQFSLVLEVLKSMSWVRREETKKKLTFFMENNYDYSKLAIEFSISKESAYVFVSRASKELENIIGVNCVEEILQDKYNIESLVINTNNIKQILIDEVKDCIKVNEDMGTDILECIKEVQSLRYLTKTSILRLFDTLDIDKLGHILYILESDDIGYAYEKEVIKGYIKGDIKKKDELEQMLKRHYV